MRPCIGGRPRAGSANGTSRRPTTGIIQAGVACATCWRSLIIHRLTISHAKTIMPKPPTIHIACATRRATGARTIGRQQQAYQDGPEQVAGDRMVKLGTNRIRRGRGLHGHRPRRPRRRRSRQQRRWRRRSPSARRSAWCASRHATESPRQAHDRSKQSDGQVFEAALAQR